MLGSPSLAQWGTPAWGDIEFDPSLFVKLESVARGDLQRTLSFDNIAALIDAQLTLGFDGLGLGTSQLSLGFDVFQGRVPTAEFLADCTQNVLLVDLRLPGGTVRFATIPLIFAGVRYEGRQVGVTTIQRTQGSGTDDVQLKLDDTDEGGQERLRDIFLANPPEGAGVTIWIVLLNDKAKNRYQLFEGNIERVAGFSRAVVSIDVVRNDAVQDVELGRLIELADFPDAPDESLSQMRPIVLGEVEDHEGVAINTNALGQLAAPTTPPVIPNPLAASTTIFFTGFTGSVIPGQPLAQIPAPGTSIALTDASAFPSQGIVVIDFEQIAYTGKLGDLLTGLTRALNGTVLAQHATGTEVREVGEFALLFADHPLSRFRNIRILGSDGNLGESVPSPTSIDFTNAIVTWSETPRVRSPSAAPEFKRVHFRDVDPTNKARGAEFTARENVSYRAFGVSQLGGADMVLRTNTDGLGVPGDMVRVWLACIFDPDTLGTPTGNPPFILDPFGRPSLNLGWNPLLPSTSQGIAGGAKAIVASQGFNLQPTDLVPEAIARQDEKTGDRIYDVPDPVFVPQIGRQGAEIISPDIVIDPGIWQRDPPVGNIIDGDPDTEAVSFFAGFGEAALIGRGDAIFVVDVPPDIGDYEPVSGKLVFIAGWGPPFTPTTSTMRVTVTDLGTGKIVATLLADSGAPAGVPSGTIVNIERFEAAVDISLFAKDLSNLDNFEWRVSPLLGVASGLWVARELFIELETKSTPPVNNATIDVKGSVTNYFEVTQLVGLSPTQDAAADWAFFSDLTRGGRATFSSNFATLDPQVIEAFWVVEFTPFLEAGSKVPRGFADVRGLTGPGGSDTPADLAEVIITRAPPLGMGLPTSQIARENYNPTKVSQLADGLRMGFAIVKPTSAVKLVEAIADQGDCRQSWDRGRHSLIRRPLPDVSLPVFKTLTELRDILLAPGIKLGRTQLGDVRTRFTAAYRLFAPSGSTSRSVSSLDAAAEVAFGRKGETVTLSLIRDDVAAQVVVARLVDRLRRPRWSIELDMALPGLELRFGDLVTIQHKDIPGGSFEVCEVVGLNFEPGGFDRVRVTCVVWKE